MFRKIVYILIMLHCSTVIRTVERRSTLELYNITCNKYTERVINIECDFVKLATGRFGVSIRLTFNRNLAKTTRVRVWLDITPGNSRQSVRMLDVYMNACSLLQQMTSNILLKEIVVEVKRTSNLPTVCPFKGNILYRMDNFNLTDNFLPPYMPSFNFTFTVKLDERNKQFSGWQVLGASVPKSKKI